MQSKRILTYAATFLAGGLAFAGAALAQGAFYQDGPGLATSSEAPRPLSDASQDKQVDGTVVQYPVANSQNPLTNVAELTRGSRVEIEGIVVRASEEDEFILEDSTGRVQVFTGNSFFVANVGEQVRVSGFVDDSLLLEVYAQEVLHSDGRVTAISY